MSVKVEEALLQLNIEKINARKHRNPTVDAKSSDHNTQRISYKKYSITFQKL
jgi:hypothetical protein